MSQGGQQTASGGHQAGLNLAQRQQLLHLARHAIGHELSRQEKLEIPVSQFASALQANRSSFVTLNRQGRLRGCIGNLVASRPLLVDVAHNASSAAFRDPRFEPLRSEELADLELHISVLGEATAVAVSSRQALLDFLIPGVHGLILQEGSRRATYLPSVWEQLPEPEQFVTQLRAKAGLDKDGWSAETRVSVYTTEEFC